MESPPDVVLFGSSLLLHPLCLADASYLKRDLDYATHHRCAYMEDLLSRRLGIARLTCFNFALPGGMISDAWIIARALLKAERKPEVIVVCMTARDFMDNKVHCAGATPAFRYLRRFVDTEAVAPLAFPHPWQRAEHYLSKVCYLWEKRLDMQVLLSSLLTDWLAAATNGIISQGQPYRLDLEDSRRANRPPEIEKGMYMAKADEYKPFQDNTREYRRRFRSSNKKLFAIETEFFRQLLSYARQEQMAVILVNMPLTRLNLKLMPAGVYRDYLHTVSELAGEFSLPFIDLNDEELFPSFYFYDTCHMNAEGGKQLIGKIVDSMAADVAISAAVRQRSSSGKLAGQPGQI